MENFKAVLMKWNVFTGRAGRREFWMFVLFNILISIALSIVDSITGLKIEGQRILSSIFSLLMFVPSISVGTRRLHDTNKSGWWFGFFIIPALGPIFSLILLSAPNFNVASIMPLVFIIGLISLVGAIITLIFLVKDSNPGENKYGPSPKMAASPAPASVTPAV